MHSVTLNGKKAAGRVVQIDDGDRELVSQYPWHIFEEERRGRTHGPYAVACVKIDGRYTTIRMHCLIMGQTGIDHRDGDGLNNQRYNLRVATDSQNHGNERPGLNGTSQFKGVYWSNNKKRWVAEIRVNRKRTYLGVFAEEEDAARAYDTAALTAWGEFSWLNLRAQQ